MNKEKSVHSSQVDLNNVSPYPAHAAIYEASRGMYLRKY